MSNMLLRFNHPNGVHAVMFEDDGRVAYAYLVERDRIVADVWLYNRCPAPNEPEWYGRVAMPFANMKCHVADEPFEMPNAANDIEVRWSDLGMGESPAAYILICGVTHAALAPGEKPGRCRLASKDGPLARVLRPTCYGRDIGDDGS